MIFHLYFVAIFKSDFSSQILKWFCVIVFLGVLFLLRL